MQNQQTARSYSTVLGQSTAPPTPAETLTMVQDDTRAALQNIEQIVEQLIDRLCATPRAISESPVSEIIGCVNKAYDIRSSAVRVRAALEDLLARC